MVDVYAELERSLAAGEKTALARIIRQSGSAPRTVGTKMLIHTDGTLVGTIGGGLLEHDVVQKAHAVMASGGPAVVHFQLSGNEVAASEMLCGGIVDVYIEPFSPETIAARDVFLAVRALTARRLCGRLITVICDGSENGGRLLIAGDGTVTGALTGPAAAIRCDPARWTPVRKPCLAAMEEGREKPLVFIEPIEAEAVLYLFGAGHISTFVAPLAQQVGFRVCVIDDRDEFANAERFPAADEILVCPFTEAFRRIRITPSAFVAIITRGHIHDRDALQAALQTRPAYIGMIGSRRKRNMIYRFLTDAGVPQERLAQVHSPIGISIGAQSPEEIAVSIVAELIRVRNQTLETEVTPEPPR
jgi:xanthine dehydrogenase accessory factor